MSPDSRPRATAATTPVPVMPRALMSLTLLTAPVEGSTFMPTTGFRDSFSTKLFHFPSSAKLKSDMAYGAASIPWWMACPSMAGPAAAEPVYSSPSWNSPISAFVP